MAKRANPFVEDYIPQSKMHVGFKQFNNNEYRLKKVYEKTLDLLFRGARKTFQAETTNTCVTKCNKNDKMKQLFIGNDGSLLHSGRLVNVSSESRQCSCGGEIEYHCSYCEAELCGACHHNCARCEESYCINCILPESEMSEVCVSCYS